MARRSTVIFVVFPIRSLSGISFTSVIAENTKLCLLVCFKKFTSTMSRSTRMTWNTNDFARPFPVITYVDNYKFRNLELLQANRRNSIEATCSLVLVIATVDGGLGIRLLGSLDQPLAEGTAPWAARGETLAANRRRGADFALLGLLLSLASLSLELSRSGSGWPTSGFNSLGETVRVHLALIPNISSRHDHVKKECELNSAVLLLILTINYNIRHIKCHEIRKHETYITCLTSPQKSVSHVKKFFDDERAVKFKL